MRILLPTRHQRRRERLVAELNQLLARLELLRDRRAPADPALAGHARRLFARTETLLRIAAPSLPQHTPFPAEILAATLLNLTRLDRDFHQQFQLLQRNRQESYPRTQEAAVL